LGYVEPGNKCQRKQWGFKIISVYLRVFDTPSAPTLHLPALKENRKMSSRFGGGILFVVSIGEF
jgi:hypothetical protein